MALDFNRTQTLLDALPAAPAPHLSDKYTFLDTRRVIEDMRDLGFEVYGFRIPKYRTKAGAFGVHDVDFRRPADMANKAVVGAEIPRLMFINSYDGSRKAQVISGVFRFICSNGMMVGTAFSKDKFIHLGDYEEELLNRVKSSGEETQKIFDRIDHYKSVRLDRKQYRDLAIDAAKLRFTDDTKIKVEPEHLLLPRRTEDSKPDLWTTWNVLQENLLKGGVPGRDSNGNVGVIRPLNQIQKSNALNRGLWDLLEQTAARAA